MIRCVSDIEIIAKPSREIELMSKSTGFQKIVRDRLFFSAESMTGKWIIAVAKLSEGNIMDPKPLEFSRDSPFADGVTPNILRAEDGFILILAGRRRKFENRLLFVARADSLDG